MLIFTIPQAACFAEVTYRQRSFALVCPECLTVWAVCHSDDHREVLDIQGEFCGRCAFAPGWKRDRGWSTPGSILESIMRALPQEEFEASLNVLPEVLDSLPADVIKSEFLIAMKAYQFYQEPSYLI